MKIKKTLLLWLFAGTMIVGCEIPGKPDFKTSQKIEAPLLYNKTFQFMGGSDALIDTTSGEMDSLFTVDDDEFILITKEQEFDFGDLNDAIPNVNVDPTSFQAEVGEITLGDFSSGGGNLGTADFQSLTGQDPSVLSAGTPIPGGATVSPVNIDIGTNTDYFVSAEIKSGALEVSVVNNLGFDIAEITVVLNSGNSQVGSTVLENVNHGFSSFNRIFFQPGDVLEDINVDISVEWDAQNMKDEPGNLVVENVEGVDLVASAVVAVVEQQSFNTNNVTVFDDSEFRFDQSTHFVELESGELLINSIQNSLDIAVDTLIISFPGIRQAPYSAADSLVISYLGIDAIPRSGTSPQKMIDLKNYRIYAENNQIEYHIKAVTEDTQTGSGADAREIEEENTVASSVSISNLAVKEAFGVIVTQNVILGDDDFTNGADVLDLFNESETQITEIDGISDFSDQFDGLEFTSPTLGINYTTSVGVGTTVYGAFLGINANGEKVFLKGIDDSDYKVSATDPITGLYADGVQLTPDQLIKFELETSSGQNLVSGAVEFNVSNTNVDDFLNNLPSEIRFIGKAVINENGAEGSINTPVQFDPVIEVGLPLAFKTTEAATFTDSSETSIDLPEDFTIKEGKIIIDYENGLPLGINLNLAFVDEFGSEFMNLPVAGENIQLEASGVDAVTRFTDAPTKGTATIALDEEQMDLINNTKHIKISAEIISTNNEEVKLRTTDSIVLTVKAELTIEAEVK